MSQPYSRSHETWADSSVDAPIEDALIDYEGSLRGVRQRTAARERIATRVFEQSRNPSAGLPIASGRRVVSFVGELIRSNPWLALAVVATGVLTAVTSLLIPLLLGGLIDRIIARPQDPIQVVNATALIIIGVTLANGVATFLGRLCSAVFGQALLSQAREYVVSCLLRLPLSRVESASTGDLVTRVTRDVSEMSEAVRWALPNFVIASVLMLATAVGLLINSWILALPNIVGAFVLVAALPSYLRKAPAGYITEGRAYSTINTTLTESVEGARTVEALCLGDAKVAGYDADVRSASEAERYTVTLRNLLFIGITSALHGPTIGIALVAAMCYPAGWVTLGQITTAILFSQRLLEPVNRLIETLDRFQVGTASTSRLLGIAEIPPDRQPEDVLPDGTTIVGSDLRFAYRDGVDVLHGIDLRLEPGERLAIVGPSGSGKSTLSRLIAGINAPRTGAVTVGGVNVMALPLQRLRVEVALVTQEHHVFSGSIRDNIVLARETTATDTQVSQALDAVGASWVGQLPSGIHTEIGSGNLVLSPAQAQQIALARLIVADPHTLVLDEATSLIDPSTARHLEDSMVKLLAGRTVVAIAHRLHTAHDADKIAVVLDGRIAEFGCHDDLLAKDGHYAQLWKAWRS